MTIGLRYVGDPFIDCGVATLTVISGEQSPEAVTVDHIEPFIQEISPRYLTTYLANFLGTVAFSNINFANVGLNKNPKYYVQRERQLRAWFGLYRDGISALDILEKKERQKIEVADEDEHCVFSGDAAVVRVSRTHIPLSGDGSAPNFAPEGRPRLPISGWCVLALLVMPMGALCSGGRLLVPHTYDRELLLGLVESNLLKNRQEFQMQGLASRPNYKFARTQLTKELLALRRKQSRSFPLTLYHFTSSEQGAKIDMYKLATNVLSFINVAQNLYPSAWNQVVERAWEAQDAVKEKLDERRGGRQIEYSENNHFYEDLFDLPARASEFLRTYLLRRRVKHTTKTDPRYHYSALNEREVISWELIGLFLERIMEMDKKRIEQIKSLGDQLAHYIEEHDQRLYGKLYRTRKPDAARTELLRAANHAKDKGVTLVPFDTFIEVFYVDEGEFLQPDWYIAFDLLLIRIIERLSVTVIETNRDEIEKADKESTILAS